MAVGPMVCLPVLSYIFTISYPRYRVHRYCDDCPRCCDLSPVHRRCLGYYWFFKSSHGRDLGVCITPAICLCICVNTVSRSLGPRNLTLGSLFPDNSNIVPTVTDNLVKQGTIKENVLGIYFEPSNSTSPVNVNGELTFGGVDSTKFIGDITYQ
jgi:hypothetical protein